MCVCVCVCVQGVVGNLKKYQVHIQDCSKDTSPRSIVLFPDFVQMYMGERAGCEALYVGERAWM